MEASKIFDIHPQNSGRHLKTQVPAACYVCTTDFRAWLKTKGKRGGFVTLFVIVKFRNI